MPADADLPYQPRPMAASGRIGRLHYWGWSTLLVLAVLLATLLLNALGIKLDWLDSSLTIATIVGTVVLSKRRLEDIGSSAWWALALIVPLVNLVVLVWLSVAPGQDGTNRYGPEPAPASRSFVILSTVASVAVMLLMTVMVYDALKTGLGGALSGAQLL